MLRKGMDLFGNTTIKVFSSMLEKKFLKEVGDMPEISMDGYENDDSEPLLQLACLLIRQKNSNVEYFKFHDSSFKSPLIHNFEFDHFSQIVKTESHWKSVYVGSGSEICWSSLSEFIPHSNIFQNVKNLMFQMDFNVPMEKLCSVLFSFKSRFGFNPNTTFYGVIDIMGEKETQDSTNSSVISELHLNFPFPMNTPRKCIQAEAIKKYEDKIVLLNRPYTDIRFKETPDLSKKLNFKFSPEVNSKDLIDVDGFIMPQLEFIQVEKIDEENSRMKHLFSLYFKN
jgi:hypothetical protein